MIEVIDLRKSFGNTEILKGVSTTLETGKINLIIGQSGSGKTVFLKSLLNVFEPTSGSILFDGRDIMKMSAKEKRQLRSEIGTVFQGSALFDSMTVEENIMFPLDMFTNFTYTEKKKRVKDPYTSKVIDEHIKDVTREYKTTTIINTHDMNSVMTIGEKIVYLRKGIKEWEGSMDILINAESQHLIDFVYSSELFKQLRDYLLTHNKNI